MDKLNFAIIGCGKIAQRHAEHIKQIGNLVAVCDIVPEKAKKFGSRYKCNSYLSVDDLLKNEKKIDIVSICTPNGLHAEHTIKALKHRHHVLVEKPMALTTHDCERMIHEAESANRRLFVVKQNRFNPPIQKLKEILDKKILGKIYSIQLNCFWNRNEKYYNTSDWKGTKKLDGGILFTQFSHFIDIIYWLFGDVEEAIGFKGNYTHKDIIEFEDTGVVALKFFNGIIGTLNYTINSFKKNFEGSLTVFAQNGTVKVGGQYLNVLEYQNIKDYLIDDLPISGLANDYGAYQGSMSNHDKVYQNIVNVLQNGSKVMTDLLDGLKTVQIIEKIYKSLDEIHE